MPDDRSPAVITEVEVVRLNTNRGQGLGVSVVTGPVPPHLPADRLRRDEDPADAARRILRDIVGVTTVHHEPYFVGFHRYAERQQPDPTLTLTFLVLGPVPDNSNDTIDFVSIQRVVEGERRNRPVIDHADTVLDARNTAFTLLETTPIALRLLGEKVTTFTLQQLLDVYRLILGNDVAIDISNFRRKVEAAHDFVRRTDAPDPPTGRGRPPRWYTAGEATLLDPPIRFRARR